MGRSLIEIAQTLKDADKKVQLIYAFNGSGKTRLSREFKEFIAPKNPETEEEETKIKIMYYNAFTEDLFYWDNDLDNDTDRKLKIQPNNYTHWILVEQGQESTITSHFQRYTNDKLTPKFNEEYTIKDNNDVTIPAYSEVRFSFQRGDDSGSYFVKISKGEESCFIWSVFYSLLEQTINVLNVTEVADRETEQFNDVLFNEFNRVKSTKKMRLGKINDGTFSIDELASDSPFWYHLFLLSELEKAIQPPSDIKKFHFHFLRNILEKTSTFLGYNKWEDLLPQESREAYYKRIINLSSHSKHNGDEISIIDENDKRVLSFLVNKVKRMYGFKSIINNNETEQNVTV